MKANRTHAGNERRFVGDASVLRGQGLQIMAQANLREADRDLRDHDTLFFTGLRAQQLAMYKTAHLEFAMGSWGCYNTSAQIGMVAQPEYRLVTACSLKRTTLRLPS